MVLFSTLRSIFSNALPISILHVMIIKFFFSFLVDYSYGGPAERMSVEEFEQGKQWLNDTFHLIRWVEVSSQLFGP